MTLFVLGKLLLFFSFVVVLVLFCFFFVFVVFVHNFRELFLMTFWCFGFEKNFFFSFCDPKADVELESVGSGKHHERTEGEGDAMD